MGGMSTEQPTPEQPIQRVRFAADIEYEIVRVLYAIKQAAYAVETAAKACRDYADRSGRR